MHKQTIIRHLDIALSAQRRAVRMGQEKYGDNHLVTQTLKMEEKELSDYIDKLKLATDITLTYEIEKKKGA